MCWSKEMNTRLSKTFVDFFFLSPGVSNSNYPRVCVVEISEQRQKMVDEVTVEKKTFYQV